MCPADAHGMFLEDAKQSQVTSRMEDPILGGFPLSLLREICILKRLKHDNIVKIFEIAATPSGDPLIVGRSASFAIGK